MTVSKKRTIHTVGPSGRKAVRIDLPRQTYFDVIMTHDDPDHVTLVEVKWAFVPTSPAHDHGRLFKILTNLVDFVLDPDSAESTIGDLSEHYARRVAEDPGHAKWWLVAQVIRIISGRALDVFGHFMRARMGK